MTIKLGGRKKGKKKEKKNNYRILTQKSKFWKPFSVSVTNFPIRRFTHRDTFSRQEEVLEFTEVGTVINFKMVVSLKRGAAQWTMGSTSTFSCCDPTKFRQCLPPVRQYSKTALYNFRACHGSKFRGISVKTLRHGWSATSTRPIFEN